VQFLPEPTVLIGYRISVQMLVYLFLRKSAVSVKGMLDIRYPVMQTTFIVRHFLKHVTLIFKEPVKITKPENLNEYSNDATSYPSV